MLPEEPQWCTILSSYCSPEHLSLLSDRIATAYAHETIYPAYSDIFSAFTLCPFDSVRVIIIGQDPYHGKGQAHGLAFSVPDSQPIPPSLRTIFKEIKEDEHLTKTLSQPTGNLTRWAQQGVLLLNTTLTVQAHTPASHKAIGWSTVTDAAIRALSDKKRHLVFLLWGTHAQQKQSLIDTTKHLVLTAPHPSPLSAYRGFLGCRHFSQTNTYLQTHGVPEIQWL